MLRKIQESITERNRWERIWMLAKTDFLKRYYGSFLGVVWALINPVFQIAVYYTVFTYVMNQGQPNFALFLFLGLIIFIFFAECTLKAMNMFSSKRYLLENIPINTYDVFVSLIISALLAFLFNFCAYILISIFSDIQISSDIIYSPLLLLNLILFSLALVIILSILSVYYKDFVHLWDMIRMALLWLSGIFYYIDPYSESFSSVLAYLTPLSGIILNSRNVFIYGEPIDWWMFGFDYIYSIVLLFIAIWIFKLVGPWLLEKL